MYSNLRCYVNHSSLNLPSFTSDFYLSLTLLANASRCFTSSTTLKSQEKESTHSTFSLQKNHEFDQCWDQLQVGDMVLLRDLDKNKTYLTGPLDVQGRFSTHKGEIKHEAIIGLKPRSVVQTHLQHSYRVHFPSLEEYVTMMPRTATPIYPKDASSVIQLLDLHPHYRILEAGTGSGALSLYLARCLMPNQGKLVSIELREKHSHQAQKWVQLYSRGIYKQRIDFWVGSLPHVFQSHPFISKYSVSSFHGAVLDLLEPWSYFHSLIPFLKLDSNLIVYVPNITQAVQCQQFIHHTHCPLVLDKCLEIIERPWEIKKVAVKWPEKIQNNEPMSFNSPTTLTSTKRIMTENSPSCHTNLKSDTVTFENEVDNLNNTCGTSNHTIHNEKNHPMSAKSELYPQPSNSSTFPSSLAMKDLNWVCRPSHMPTGHTAFLLKFKVVGN